MTSEQERLIESLRSLKVKMDSKTKQRRYPEHKIWCEKHNQEIENYVDSIKFFIRQTWRVY